MNAIFYIRAFFPTPRGATYSAFRLAQTLRNQGVGVSFVVEQEEKGREKAHTYDKFPVHSFMLEKSGKLRKLLALWRFTRLLFRERNNFDIFHIHGGSYVSLFLSRWVSIITGKPSLLKITLDGWDTPDGIAATKHHWITLGAYKRLAAVVAMTTGQARKVKKWGYTGKIFTIPNGLAF